MSERSLGALGGPGVMLFSAAIFAYFGLMTAFPDHTNPPPPEQPQPIALVMTLKWTLRITAVAFGLSALLAMAQAIAGNLLYSLAGLVSAVALAVVGIWDIAEPLSLIHI